MSSSSFKLESQNQLRQQIQRLYRAGATFSYPQLEGFLFAILCSPEEVEMAEWFELIWLTDEPQFEEEAEAKAFYRLLGDYGEHLNQRIEAGECLPFAESYDESWQQELGQWCDGFLIGHQYLEELWVLALGDLAQSELADAVDATLNLATTFADLFSAKQLSMEDGIEFGDRELTEAYGVFGQVLAVYADTGRMWGELIGERDSEQLFELLESVPADHPCPCGSGLPFAKCCLH